MLTCKGVFPYDLVTSFKWFKETKFPNYEEFVSLLKQENITYTDYILCI